MPGKKRSKERTPSKEKHKGKKKVKDKVRIEKLEANEVAEARPMVDIAKSMANNMCICVKLLYQFSLDLVKVVKSIRKPHSKRDLKMKELANKLMKTLRDMFVDFYDLVLRIAARFNSEPAKNHNLDNDVDFETRCIDSVGEEYVPSSELDSDEEVRRNLRRVMKREHRRLNKRDNNMDPRRDNNMDPIRDNNMDPRRDNNMDPRRDNFEPIRDDNLEGRRDSKLESLRDSLLGNKRDSKSEGRRDSKRLSLLGKFRSKQKIDDDTKLEDKGSTEEGSATTESSDDGSEREKEKKKSFSGASNKALVEVN